MQQWNAANWLTYKAAWDGTRNCFYYNKQGFMTLFGEHNVWAAKINVTIPVRAWQRSVLLFNN